VPLLEIGAHEKRHENLWDPPVRLLRYRLRQVPAPQIRIVHRDDVVEQLPVGGVSEAVAVLDEFEIPAK
jgi:hypothetical protein